MTSPSALVSGMYIGIGSVQHAIRRLTAAASGDMLLPILERQ
jgi:hypothetical protein